MLKRIAFKTLAVCLLFLLLSPYTFIAKSDHEIAEINIDIPKASYDKLISSEKQTQYRVSVSKNAALSLDAKINIRGSSTKTVGFLTKTKRIPFELKFPSKSDFDHEIANKSIKFLSCFSVYHLIAEYLALELFEDFGIPTPAHKIVFVKFNGIDFGLYIAVEDVNKTFINKHYGNFSGSVIKATNQEEKRTIISPWLGSLFEKENRGIQTFNLLTEALVLGENIQNYVNLDEWLRFFACVAAIGGDGSIFTEQNNFILYDNNGIFDLIPWDLSQAFSGIQTKSGIDQYFIYDSGDSNPLFEVFMKEPANREKYHNYLRQICDGFLNPKRIEPMFSEIVTSLLPFLARDHSIALNCENVEEKLRSDSPEGMLNLLYELKGLHKNLCAQLEGKEDTFFVNQSYIDIYPVQNFSNTVALFENNSPLLDPQLPQKIEDAAKQTNTFHLSPVVTISLGIVASVFISSAVVLIVSKKRTKKNG